MKGNRFRDLTEAAIRIIIYRLHRNSQIMEESYLYHTWSMWGIKLCLLRSYRCKDTLVFGHLEPGFLRNADMRRFLAVSKNICSLNTGLQYHQGRTYFAVYPNSVRFAVRVSIK